MIVLLASVSTSLPTVGHLLTPMSLADRMSYSPYLITSVVDLCLAVACLALWRAAPDYPIFRTFGLYILIASAIQLWTYLGGQNSSWPLNSLAAPLLIATAGEAMHVRYRLWVRILVPLGLGVLLAGWYPALAYFRSLPTDVSQIMLAIMIVQGFRRRGSRDRRIPLAFTAFFLVRWLASRNLGAFLHLPEYIWIYGWRWSLISIAVTILGAATLGLFVRDLILDRHEKLRLAAELAAGRAVQEILISEDIPAIPGFNLQSVYKPFGEVGGDFFQVLQVMSDGAAKGVLVIIGDVSGKGLPAAMTVSLLLGAAQTLADSTDSPSEMLAAMNHRMLTRSNGGFTTCLVLRADPDGTLTIANAGHIAPYLAGQELALNNGLPLGISADAIYAESTFQLMTGQQLTLLTDGVIEARDKSGALFGFEATAAISTESANQIAKTAELFGQEDDITVLSLTRAVGLNPAPAQF